jgi:2-polyprenyl-3-methyl-5-hydroxy-6-metoxy-1,4-benzoquinol methylase
MATLTESLRNLQIRIESFFPPARVNRKVISGVRKFTQGVRKGKQGVLAYYRCLRWPRRRLLMEELQAKRAVLVERLENMDESVEQALERTGAHYKDVRGKAKAVSDSHFHALRWYATSQLLTSLRPEDSSKVLDIACNSGLQSIVIKSEHPQLDCYAVDINEKLIAMASVLKRHLGVEVDFRVASGQDLAKIFGNMKFDYIFICELLEHFEFGKCQQDILDAARSVCSANGRIFVTVPYKNRIPFEDHHTIFHRHNLTQLLKPYAKQLHWHEEARHNLGLEAHFVVSFEINNGPQCN